MTGKQLKNSILQLAIQGKLVAQDPNDEPASVLLSKIRKEKEALVKEKKLKKKDLVSKPIADEEKQFELPEGWEWCRLGDIGIFERGNGIKRDETQTEGYPCVRYGEMYTAYRNNPTFDRVFSFTTKEVFDKCRKAHKGDLFMALTGENKQDIALAAQYIGDEEIAVGGDLCHFTVLATYALYFVYLINSPYFSSKKELLAKGDIIVHISTDKLGSVPIPLPPLREQKRIVAKIEELMPVVEKYEKAQTKLEALNKSLPEALKKSILQEAIQGKLVPQDDNDEPASELLKKIRKEKEQLVKEGKLKKIDLVSEPIAEEEKPFELPEGWEWCRLGEISTYSQTKRKINASYADSQLWQLDLEDIEKGGKLLCRKSVGERKSIGDKTFFCKGNILYSKLRPYLLKILVAPEDGICTPEIVPFSCYGNISHHYIVCFLKSTYVDEYINSVSFGIKMPRVSTETMIDLLVPLPPLAEQKRIVDKLELLLSKVDHISKKIK